MGHDAFSWGIIEERVNLVPVALARLPEAPNPQPAEEPSAPISTRWTARRLCAVGGFDESTLFKWLKRDPPLRKYLHADANGCLSRKKDNGITDGDAEDAIDRLCKLIDQKPKWNPRGRREKCRQCKRTTSSHRGRGLCCSCWHRKARQKQGLVIRHLGAWDTARGLAGCLVCARSSVPHKVGGRCNGCMRWHYYWRSLPPDQYVFAVADRRRTIAAGNTGKGKATCRAVDRRYSEK